MAARRRSHIGRRILPALGLVLCLAEAAAAQAPEDAVWPGIACTAEVWAGLWPQAEARPGPPERCGNGGSGEAPRAGWRHGMSWGRAELDLSAGVDSLAPADETAEAETDAALRYDAFARLRGRDRALPLSYGLDLRRQGDAAEGEAAREVVRAMAMWDFSGAYRLDGTLARTRDPARAEDALLSSALGLRGPLGRLGGGTLTGRLAGGIDELPGDWQRRLGVGLGWDFGLAGWRWRAAPGLETLQQSAAEKLAAALRFDLSLSRHGHAFKFAQSVRREVDGLGAAALGSESALDYRYSWPGMSLGLEWSHIDPAALDAEPAWRVRAVWRVRFESD